MGGTFRQVGTWIRVGLLCLAGVSPGSYAQPVKPASCGATGVASHDGFFTLRVAGETLGIPATAQVLRKPGELPFAAIIVPSAMRASVPAEAPDRGVTFLPTAPSRFGSTLVRGDPPLSVENVEWNRVPISIVVYNAPGGGAYAVAAMIADSLHGPTTRVQLMSLSLPDSVPPVPGLDVARAEHLYTMAFREAADARYCTPSSRGGCDDRQLLSQGEALQRLASHRECAVATLPDGVRATLPRWRVVTLSAKEAPPGGNARVSARLLDRDVPVAGARVTFSRPPHSLCTATTQADGTATCELADTHGHDDDEDEQREFGRAPVLVTFPGDLQGNPILLPTTRLVPTRSDAPHTSPR